MFKKKQNTRFPGPIDQFQASMFGQQPGFSPDMMHHMQPGMQPMPPGMQPMHPGMQPDSAIFPQVHEDRLQFEISENRRRINNLTKRVIRLENYLRIRDTSEYVNIDDDHFPNEFSM